MHMNLRQYCIIPSNELNGKHLLEQLVSNSSETNLGFLLYKVTLAVYAVFHHVLLSFKKCWRTLNS